MFEIPDDDENFWESLPLDDITKIQENMTPESNNNIRHKTSQDIGFDTEVVSCKSSSSLRPVQNTFHPACSSNKSTFVSNNNTSLEFPTSSRYDQNSTENNTKISRKRKRKFPGPAGILPKLDHNQLSKVDVKVSDLISNASDSHASVLQKDDCILSSQVTEDIFNDFPWQSLLKDLGSDAEDIVQKFSIASNLFKARKKLLNRGKMPLILAVIETLDWSGSDASICLKDKSGKIQGSLHHSIIKDRESDLHPGCALVLRQVSVISPTSRNHYLNITPSNIVMIYSSKCEQGKINLTSDRSSLLAVVNQINHDLSIDSTPQHAMLGRMNLHQMVSTPSASSQMSERSEVTPKNMLFNRQGPVSLERSNSLAQNSSTPTTANGFRFQRTGPKTPSYSISNNLERNNSYALNVSPENMRNLGTPQSSVTGNASAIQRSCALISFSNENTLTSNCSLNKENKLSSSLSEVQRTKPLAVNLNSNQSPVTSTPGRKFSFKSRNSTSSPCLNASNLDSAKYPSIARGNSTQNFRDGNINAQLNEAKTDVQTDNAVLQRNNNTLSFSSNSEIRINSKEKPCFQVDESWEDDLSDDLLSQLTEDMI